MAIPHIPDLTRPVTPVLNTRGRPVSTGQEKEESASELVSTDSATRDQNLVAVKNDNTPDWLSDANIEAFYAEMDAPVAIAA